MKAIIFTLIGLGLCAQAKSASLSTVDGATYNNITVQRAEPDGLYIEYTPPGGGIGISKVKFSRLSQDQQKQFGFDPNKAKDYEVQVAMAQLRAAEADLARATDSSGNYGWSSLGGADGLFAIRQTGRIPRATTDYAPVVTPIPFPSRSTPRSSR